MVRSSLVSVKRQSHSAFTMIELIYAIVVIAVVTLTIPMMIQVNNKSIEENAHADAIFLISSVLSEETAVVWDNRSIVGGPTAINISLSKILDVPTGDAVYKRLTADINNTMRIGGINEDGHRQFYSTVTNPVQSATVTIINSGFKNAEDGERFGLKDKYSVFVTSRYISDTPNDPFVFGTVASSVSNIKMLEVNVKDKNAELISVMRAYTCNIGEVDYARRSF